MSIWYGVVRALEFNSCFHPVIVKGCSIIELNDSICLKLRNLMYSRNTFTDPGHYGLK